jgi:heat shock protein HslJ
LNGNVVFTSDTAHPVLGDYGTHVDMLLQRAASMGTPPLENTHWKLTVLRGAPIATVDRQHEAYLILDPAQKRVAGSGGCNRLVGAYTLNDDHLSFSRMAGTMMACAQGMDEERIFLQTLPAVTSWRIAGQRLDLLDQHGTVLAQFEAGAMP